ncbi:MAG: glycosyl hydrolase family 28 protein, partial [Candidatus Omnitrophota bacterium]
MANRSIRFLIFSGLFLTSVLAFADSPQKPFYNILDYGAVADGKTLNTQAIQSAIDDAAQAGGGVVLIPAGSFLTGAIFMKSRLTLHLQSGAALLGSKDIVDYATTIPQIRSYTDNYVKQSLIYGENLEDIAITGRGTIDGQGAAFRWKEYKNRPYIIRFISCRHVLIEDIFLKNSPMWMQHYLACEDVTVRGIRVVNHSTYNNDGIDIDSCRNVRISDCSFDSDDDALCLKSTTGRPCEDIAITNCVLSSHCNAFKMGTESNGGFTDIAVSNLSIHSPRDAQQDYG